MAEVIPYRFKLRGGTAAAWNNANPILLEREPGIETDTGAIKIGNGTSAWRDLPYSGRNTGQLLLEADQAAAARIAAQDVGTIRNRVDTMWANQGGGGSQGPAYDDTALRSEIINRDNNVLNTARGYTDTRETAIRAAIPTDTVTNSQLAAYATTANTATKQEVTDAETRANTTTSNLVTPLAARVTTLEGRPRSQVMTQAAYNALGTKNADTIYFITA